jgi:two-component system, chemotaxis family, chemotaxis protein CheY
MVNVLIVDDTEYMRRLLRRILSTAGHQIVGEASNGEDAITLFKKTKPDVVLLDIVLEQQNTLGTGLDALKKMVKIAPKANIIIISGLDEQSIIADSMQNGAKAFIAKPIDPEKVLETIIMCTDLRIIAEMANMGAERIATVLSKFAGQPIQIEMPKLEAGPSHLVANFSGLPQRTVTAVKMGLQNEPCEALLIFEPEEALKIADIVTKKSIFNDIDDNLKMSTVKEMGSNMLCAFFSAVGDYAEMTLIPSSPELITDSFEAIIDVSLAERKLKSSSALIFNISFRRKESSARGYFVMLNSDSFQNQLITRVKEFSNSTELLQTNERTPQSKGR